MSQMEIVAAIDRLGDAFTSGDPDLVLSQFVAADAVIYAGSEAGELAVGRAAIRNLLVDIFKRDERYSWQCGTSHIVDTAGGVFVVADATLTVHPVDEEGQASPRRAQCLPYRITGLLERYEGQWRWRCCHGSEPAPSASHPDTAAYPRGS